MIPKIIHYCWFGKNQKSKLLEKSIASWEKYCPDFEIKEWDETNTQAYQNKFYKDALRKKKYAFVADCIRAQTLYEFGGVYLDTDMLLVKPIDISLLQCHFFTGYEVKDRAAYGFYGAIPNHRFLKMMVNFYNNTEFNEFSLPVITHAFKDKINNQTISENEIIFNPNYFYPLPYEQRLDDYKNYITPETYAVHLWDHSWEKKEKKKIKYLLNGLQIVLMDYFFYGYSKQYFVRYSRGFSRQLYYYIFKKGII